MRTTPKAITSVLLLTTLALAGCGSSTGSGTSSSPAPAETLSREVALQSPVLPASTHVIPRGYTCDGRNVRLPLQWRAVPPGTRELALLVLSLQPVQSSGSRVFERVTVVWAVTGLSPTLRQLPPGKLPPGAVIGRNARRDSSYSICPLTGVNQDYLIALFFLPRPLSERPGFSDETLFATLRKARAPFGELFASYSRA